MGEKIKILWKHPNLRDYRIPLFDKLYHQYSIHFLFTRTSVWDDKYKHTILEKRKETEKKRFANYRILLRHVIRDDYDVFIASFLYAPLTLLAVPISKLRKKKVIIWEEKWLLKSSFKARILDFFVRFLFVKFVDAFFVCGDCQKNYWIQRGVSPDIIFVAPESSIDISLFKQVEVNLDIEELKKFKIILSIGRNISTKGIMYLIQAFRNIESKVKDAFLLIVGDGTEQVACIKLAADYGLKNYKFVRPIFDNNHKAYLFHIAKVIVVPSIITETGSAEGGPIVIPEAFSAGRPVVVTDTVGSSLDVVDNEVNGLIVKQKDSDDLAEKIISILSGSDKQYQKYCLSARQTYENVCSYDNMANVFRQSINFVYNK